MPDIAVVIVSYRTGPTLHACLDRVLAEPGVGTVALVDNGNDAATLAALTRRGASEPRLRVLSGHGNVGFAAGCNRGARATAEPVILLLNPDCLIERGSLQTLRAAVGDRPHPWIATVRVLDESGTEQRGSRRNAGTPGQCVVEALRLGGVLTGLNLNRAPLPAALTVVPAISGAFMLMPRPTFEALGGLDEGYFLHVEDLDFCLRLRRAGGVAYFAPDLTCTHVKGTSAAPALAVERHKVRGFRRFFRTHFAASHPRVVLDAAWLLLAGGLLLRGWLQDLRRA
ncbi:MAG: glycosyltransferase family 2 protein [Alphaproteobacteria bacterium]|nr:glycosyltransferase family 2 protein [Alphaproteobacteria bacterium]